MTATTTDTHTIPEKLLLAADAVAALRSPWPISQLVVAAWRRWPETFGLAGYEQTYPSDKRVESAVLGKRGMASCGYFVKVLPNVYKLTQDGVQCIKWLKEGNGSLRQLKASKRTPDALNGNEANPLILTLQGTLAYREDYAGRRSGILFAEAIQFFNGEDRYAVRRELTEIAESDSSESGEARVLRNLADHLVTRFERQWELHDERMK